MVKVLWALTVNTFRETIRDKLLYSLVGFAALVIAASLLAGSVSLGQDVRVFQNFGLTAILVFQLVITLFIGTQLLSREIERKTALLVLSKPISREMFYLGKFLGLALTLTVTGVIMGLIFLILVFAKTGAVSPAALFAVIFIILEVWLLTAVGMLFGGMTSPLASAVYTFCLALIGHASTTIWILAQRSGSVVRGILEFIYYIFPNLEKFNLRNDVVFNLTPEPIQIGMALLYFTAYTSAILLIGLAIFRRHEF